MDVRRKAAALIRAFVILAPVLCSAQTAVSGSPLASESRSIWGSEREALTREYFRLHAGEDEAALRNPKLIVVHCTGTDSLDGSIGAFVPPRLAGRADIAAGGTLNVGVHYLIASDGRIIALLPEEVRGRHAIGFNHCSIGIEMVAAAPPSITEPQSRSCAALIEDLAERHPSILYLIGHHEYARQELPHFALFQEKDESYGFTEKWDPGDAFMEQLRLDLKRRGIVLKD